MLDWKDDVLADIFWSQIGEVGDHIVPHSKDSQAGTLSIEVVETHSNENASSILHQKVSSDDQFPGKVPGENSDIDRNEKLPDSSQNVPSPNSENINVYNHRLSSGSVTGETTVISEEPRLLKSKDDVVMQYSQDEHGYSNACTVKSDRTLYTEEEKLEDKEGNNLLDYGLAEIGDFEDLDKIFRNDYSTLGDEMMSSLEEMWPSSTNVASNDVESFFTNRSSLNLRMSQSEFDPYFGRKDFIPSEFSSTKFDRNGANESISFYPENMLCPDRESEKEDHKIFSQMGEYDQEMSKSFSEKMNGKKKRLPRGWKSDQRTMGNLSQNMINTRYPSVKENQELTTVKMHACSMDSTQILPSSILGSSSQVGVHKTTDCLSHIPNVPLAYGYPTHQFLSIGLLKHGDHSKTSLNLPPSHLSMTPQEKIEKLRRRQQMQAMIAIKHQQEQFGNHSTDDSSIPSHEQENLYDDVDQEKDIEKKINFPKEKSNEIMCMSAREWSNEETILADLQDAIVKLDTGTRTCIYNSLLRLAKSAVQRHNVNDKDSVMKSRTDIAQSLEEKETDSPRSTTRVLDAETATNRIDRTVAHFLFCKPSEGSNEFIKDMFSVESNLE